MESAAACLWPRSPTAAHEVGYALTIPVSVFPWFGTAPRSQSTVPTRSLAITVIPAAMREPTDDHQSSRNRVPLTSSPCLSTGGRVRRGRHQGIRSEPPRAGERASLSSWDTRPELARQGLQAAVLGQDSALDRRFRSKTSGLELGLSGGALHSCSESSAVEPGEGQMGNVGYDTIYAPRISSDGPAISSLQTVHPART